MNKENKKNTLVINLLGGPGSAKSTTAALIFYKLKCLGIDAELVNEYAKQLVWEQSFPKMKNQIYIFGKQHNKQWMLNGKVDVIITDSPLLLNVYYDFNQTKGLKDLILSEFHNFHNLNIMLNRVGDYNPNGRTQTEEQAKNVDTEIRELLKHENIDYHEGNANNIDAFIDLILYVLDNLKNNKF